MKCSVTAALNPLAIVLRVEIADAQYAMRRTVRSRRLDFRDKADECRVAFEDHVELAHTIALHAVRALRIDLVPIHVTIDALNHRRASQITFQIAKPILRMCRPQGRAVFLDERLKDAVD